MFRPRSGRKRRSLRAAGPTQGQLVYNGGAVQTAPIAYLIFWGFDGATDTTDDPYGLASYLTAFVQSIPGSSWLEAITQYYQTAGGANVYIPNGTSLFGGATYDPVPPAAKTFTDAQAAQEAVKIAQSVGYNADANYVVVTPHTYTIDGFGTSFCGYHSSVSTDSGPLSYTVLPYMPDAEYSCGEGSVDVPGTLDGVTIVGGHEVAEAQTDPVVGTGWLDANGNEIADKCQWTNLQNTRFAKGRSYPTQPLWSNASSSCVQSYAAPSPSPAVSPTPVASPTPAVSPTPVASPTPIVSPTPGPSPTPPPPNLLRNANFDSGRLRPWRTCRSNARMPDASVTTQRPHSGTYDAYAGTLPDRLEPDGMTAICQLVTIPAAAHLTVWMRGVTDDHRNGVFQFVRIYSTSEAVVKTLFRADDDEQQWHERNFDLAAFANGRYYLAFGIEGRADARGRHVGQYVDDVTLSP